MLVSIAALGLLGCDAVGLLAVQNTTTDAWYVVTASGSDKADHFDYSVKIGPGEEGTIYAGIGYTSHNVVVILLDADCKLADVQTVNGDRVWLQISTNSNLPELNVPSPSPSGQPNTLPHSEDCTAPGLPLRIN